MKVQPCCRFMTDMDHLPTLDLQNPDFRAAFDSAFNSPFQQKLRSMSLRGEMIEGCQKCNRHEKMGLRTLRNQANSELPRRGTEGLRVEPEDIQYLEIFIGNVCNLKCMTCDPSLSSSWEMDYNNLGWSVPRARDHVNYESLIPRLPRLNHIKFVGGEPILNRHHFDVLSSIPQATARRMRLTYNTNVMAWPKSDLLNIWKQYETIDLILSIDGFGTVNDYIRFPSRWNQIEENTRNYFEFAKTHPGFRISVNCTVSIYNVFSLDPLEKWFTQIRNSYPQKTFHFFLLNPLVSPDFMDIRNLPDSLKQEAISRLDLSSAQQKNIETKLRESGDPSLKDKFIDFTRSIDNLRKQNVSSAIPQLAAWFQG